MSSEPSQVSQAIQNARDALRRGEQSEARRWAEQAARLAPETEDPWLLLAAVSKPRAALEYASRALVINPQSARARKAVDWARNRLGADAPASRTASLTYDVQPPARRAASQAPKKTTRRSPIYPILLFGFGCLVVIFAFWSAANSPAVASILNTNNDPLPTPTLEAYFAQAEFAKPTYTPEWTPTSTLPPTITFTPVPTFTPTLEFTFTPRPTDTPLPTETPGLMEAAIVPDTATPIVPPTRPYVAPTQVANVPLGGGSSGTSYGVRWIDVNLSQQMVYAYEGDVVVNSFLASTGVAATPTVTGSYKIYVKYRFTDMSGPGYYLPDVPYVMYFYKGYGIHGTYWHNNFGTPMSRGCVNLSIPDAGWLFDWASVGTTVNVHY